MKDQLILVLRQDSVEMETETDTTRGCWIRVNHIEFFSTFAQFSHGDPHTRVDNYNFDMEDDDWCLRLRSWNSGTESVTNRKMAQKYEYLIVRPASAADELPWDLEVTLVPKSE